VWLANGGWVCVSLEEVVTAYLFPDDFQHKKLAFFPSSSTIRTWVDKGLVILFLPVSLAFLPAAAVVSFFSMPSSELRVVDKSRPASFITGKGCQKDHVRK